MSLHATTILNKIIYMFNLLQRFVTPKPPPDEKQQLMAALHQQLIDMRASAIAGKIKCLSERENHKSKLAAKKLAYSATYFDKIINLLNKIIASNKAAFLGLPPDTHEEQEGVIALSGLVVSRTTDSDDEKTENGYEEDDWTSDEEEDVYEHFEEVARTATPALEILPVNEINTDLSVAKLTENINQLHYLIQRFYTALEHQFFHQQNSYAALLSLQDSLHHSENKNQAQLIKLKLIICQKSIVDKKMELLGHEMAILDLLNGTNNLKTAIANVLRKKLAELDYIASIQEAINAQEQLNNDLDELKDPTIERERREVLQIMLPVNKSNVLITRLVALFQHIKLDARISQSKMQDPLKTEFINLINEISDFHNKTYCDPDNLQQNFFLEPDLINNICRLHVLCEQKYKSEIDSITTFIKENLIEKTVGLPVRKLIT